MSGDSVLAEVLEGVGPMGLTDNINGSQIVSDISDGGGVSFIEILGK